MLFSVFEISKSTFKHQSSLVRKAEKCFQIKNNSKIEVAPKLQSIAQFFTDYGPSMGVSRSKSPLDGSREMEN